MLSNFQHLRTNICLASSPRKEDEKQFEIPSLQMIIFKTPSFTLQAHTLKLIISQPSCRFSSMCLDHSTMLLTLSDDDRFIQEKGRQLCE